jgi:hypothetical protein
MSHAIKITDKKDGLFWICRKPDFVQLFVDLKKYDGDPLSPPEGEAAQGVYPLDPLLQSG